MSTPVVSTRGEMRRNMGRAYEGRALWIFCKKLLQSKPPVVSAIAAMPAFPSTPGVSYGEKWNIRNTGEGNMPKKSFKKMTTISIKCSPGTVTP